ncbi:OLC1v1015597C1 [Oldenlandia corymbosa var. corymbosa]|uniref:OLC1v1015597C1 n=1 Tax=Oldenlandia corymbosa var. corymbosa TaxID=529605 RepID=A0AAV1E3V4_OLDCO|nr:OLC1v1015597C1 [Oldenlandia corymbosa var. corymbosa]
MEDEKNPPPLDEGDIALLKSYGESGPYITEINKAEKDIKETVKKIKDLSGIKESDTGLALPSRWDLPSDQQMLKEEQSLRVARCTKIINPNTAEEQARYVVTVRGAGKFVVGLGDKVSPTDIEEGMRVGVDQTKFQIQIPLPPRIDPSITMMTVEEKPDVTYNDLARSKKACILFFDEVDAIGGARFDDGAGGDNEVQRTMLELINQLDGFDPRGNIKVIMATNRPDTLDPALLRPGRLDRKVEFGLPDMESRAQILKIHTRTMNCDRGIRFELLARLCPNTTGAEIRSVCTEAGMFAIRARRKTVTEKDFLDAVNKVIKGYKKFSSTAKYMVYN